MGVTLTQKQLRVILLPDLGKKKMKTIGRVEVPKEAFLEVTKLG